MSQHYQTTHSQDSDVFASLEGVQLDPYTLRRIFLLLTRNHFADPNYFGEVPDSFKHFTYRDGSSSPVKIELDFTFDPEKSEQDTAIYIGVSDIQSSDSGVLNQFAGLNEDFSGREFTNTDTCQVILTHVAPTADEALILGIISKAFFQGIRTLLQERLCVRAYQVAKLTRPTPAQPNTADPFYRSDLILNLIINNDWTTSIESHRIKRVSFDLS